MERKITIKIFALALVMCFITSGKDCRAQEVSLKNNLLYDATLTPNLGIEMTVDSVWSVGLNAGFRIWPRSKWATRKYRHLLIAPEVRRWFSHTGQGHFVGADILYTHFNVVGVKMPFGLYPSIRHKRKQGDAVALGPFYGYAWRLARHWSIEAEGGIDVGYEWADVFPQDKLYEKIGTDKGVFLMPKLGVNIIYKFKSKK